MDGEHTGVSSQHLLIFVVASMLVLTLFRKKWAVRWPQAPSLLLLLSSRNAMATLIMSRVVLIFNPPYSKCQTSYTNTSLSCNLMCELWHIYLAIDPFIFQRKWGALLDAVLATSTTSLYCELHYYKSTMLHQATWTPVDTILYYGAMNPSYQVLYWGRMSTRQQLLSRLLSTMELTCFCWCNIHI